MWERADEKNYKIIIEKVFFFNVVITSRSQIGKWGQNNRNSGEKCVGEMANSEKTMET